MDVNGRIAVSVGEAAAMCGCSRAFLYGYVTGGSLPSVRLGKRRLIRIADLEEWMAGRATSAAAASHQTDGANPAGRS